LDARCSGDSAARIFWRAAPARLWRGGGSAVRRSTFSIRSREHFDIVLFGAGHVGRALVGVLAGIDCRVTWVDARDDAFPADVPANIDVVCTDAPEQEVDAARPGSYFLVMTHSHPLDEALAEQILRRNDAAYFGLIGSIAKRRQFERRMERRGMPPARLAAMTCRSASPVFPAKAGDDRDYGGGGLLRYAQWQSRASRRRSDDFRHCLKPTGSAENQLCRR
jgi:xanthine dehydrogenase accessory factor